MRQFQIAQNAAGTSLASMMKGYGYQTFDQSAFHDIIGFAMPTAHHVIQPSCQAAVLIAEMHRRSLLLPSVTVIEALVRRARQQADQLVHDVFAGELHIEHSLEIGVQTSW